ncbi:MAG: MBL fold metallo-hydrolase [Bacteroidaceae bacterium]|nr:MBL fold metallo-hydrolase [Bacteroidaceae bacterium]
MRKRILSFVLASAAMLSVNAQGYYIYKDGSAKQIVLSSDMDSLVFFKEGVEKTPAEEETVDPNNPTANKAATAKTAELNNAWLSRLDFQDQSELENAKRGCLKSTPDLIVYNGEGDEVWNMADFKFLYEEGAVPATVNPSLWQNSLCNVRCGLFEVIPDKIYQVRGYDMANMTFIKTPNNRWIIVDVLMGNFTAKAAMDLFKSEYLHSSSIDIAAVVISHTHIDHYGGITEVLKDCKVADAGLDLAEQVKDGKTAVIVPQGFMKYVISENVYAGPAMKRRANYQYGAFLPRGVTGRMAMGIGMGQSVNDVAGLAAPTFQVGQTGEYVIDGLKVTFQITPGTEAPAEMNAYFPDYNALWMAENCTGTLHNLYTLRGAEVRDAENWCNYILEAKQKFGKDAQVVFQSHNWPHWGNSVVNEYLENTASIYKFIHDQTLHYVNRGYTSTEISNMLQLPEKLDKVWYTRQYYGTLSHNIKAVYQKYMGWYDANPVNLNLLPPTETAKKVVEYMGDAQRVLNLARADFAKGDYQWVAQVTKELVYADPSNMEARRLCADALEQLAYQSESGTWRNAYLTGAMELRAGTPAPEEFSATKFVPLLAVGTIDMLFEFAAIINNSNELQDKDVTVNFIIGNEKACVVRRNGVVLVYKNETRDNADATASGDKKSLVSFFTGNYSALTISGNSDAVISLMPKSMSLPGNFGVIEP